MEFRATSFDDFAALPAELRRLLEAFLSASSGPDAAAKWVDLTSTHDDQAAAMLGVFNALAQVTMVVNGGDVSALGVVERLHLTAGDRVYADLSRPLFDDWRQQGEFRIALADGQTEAGRVRFNRGQLGASLHRGFDVQGVTAVNRIPRIQWNYRLCDGLADIDLDGFSPFNPLQHLTYANSDCRQWYDRYQAKFGGAGFTVDRVGNVPELRVEDTSVCRLPDAQLTAAEQAGALNAASSVSQTLSSQEFREWAESSRSGLAPVLRDPDASPLDGEVVASVRADAPEADLFGYYTARVDVDQSFRVLGAARFGAAFAEAQPVTEPIETIEELRARRVQLESQAAVFRQDAARAAAGARVEPALGYRTRAWLSRTDGPTFGYRQARALSQRKPTPCNCYWRRRKTAIACCLPCHGRSISTKRPRTQASHRQAGFGFWQCLHARSDPSTVHDGFAFRDAPDQGFHRFKGGEVGRKAALERCFAELAHPAGIVVALVVPGRERLTAQGS